ncbi:MAG: hypothetical protein AAF502_24465 [Bacteroidota bacterium]
MIRTFSSSELLGFRDFVASPYFNKNKELEEFYAFIKKLYPRFPEKKLQREYVYASLFPGKKYDDKHLNYLMSFLLKLAEQFIGIQHYTHQNSLPEFHILSSLIERKLEKNYRYTHKKTTTKLNKSVFRNINHDYQQYLMAEASNRYFSNQLARRHDNSLQLAADHFDTYYLGNKLKYSCEMVNRKNVISVEYEIHLLEEIKQHLSQYPHEDHPAIHIYHTILLMLTEEDSTRHFEKLKELLDTKRRFFPKTEMLEFFQYALNFCIRKINKGEPRFLEESINLYLKGIDTAVLLDNGVLSPWAYKNVIAAGLRLKRFDWVEEFIVDYNEKLAQGFRQNALHYNLAELNFYKKAYEKAQDHLNQVVYSDIYINLDSKKMLLKIFYESGEEEALFSLLAAYQIFIKRNKLISSKVKEHYLNFHKILYQLSRNSPRQMASLPERLAKMESVADRNWLKRTYDKIKVI